MARYPDSPRPISPYNFRVNRPFVGGGPEWAQQTRPLTRFSLYEADLTYRGKSWAQIMTLHNFFESVDGAAGRFTFVDFNGIGPIGGGADPGVAWSGLFVAKGDGTTVSWDLPTFRIKAFPAPVVYENGTAKTTAIWTGGSTTPAAGTYLIIPANSDDTGAGTDGVDLLHAGTAPAASVIITIDATCRRAERRARFIVAKNPFVLNVPANYYQGPVTIVGVRK
jgi:hypothetical protein